MLGPPLRSLGTQVLCLVLGVSVVSPGNGSLAYGQETRARAQTLQRLLQSVDLKDRTWGAYWVGEQRAVELLDYLSAFLQPPPTTGIGDEREAFYRAVLDTLIRLGADLPVQTLTGIIQHYPPEGVILFAQASREKRSALLDVFRQQMSDVPWQAVGNLLVGEKLPGFAVALLAPMQEIRVTISVTDRVTDGGVAGSIASGIRTFFVPKDYPPIGCYRLTNEQSAGGVMVAPGPHPIYYERTVVQPGDKMGVENSYRDDNRDPRRLEYLALMLDLPTEEVRFDTNPVRTVQWSTQEDYRRAVEEICQLVLKAFDSLHALLAARGLITSSEAAAIRAHVHLRVFDNRQDKSIPLPEPKLSRMLREP